MNRVKEIEKFVLNVKQTLYVLLMIILKISNEN